MEYWARAANGQDIGVGESSLASGIESVKRWAMESKKIEV